MKQNKFKILIFVFALIIINISSVDAISLKKYVNEKTNYEAILEDDANLLSEENLEKLKEEIIPLTEYGNIAFKTINENSTSTSSYASTYYLENFGFSSGTLFIIDMYNREIYIYSKGENYKTITRDNALIITDNVYNLASDKKYYECASEAFDQINTLLQGGKILEKMRYVSNIFISATLSFFLVFIIIFATTKIKKAKNKEILKNCNVLFDVKDIKVKKTGEHREYSPRSSSGGGLSGGGRSFGGGGRSSGGGGGHRF